MTSIKSLLLYMLLGISTLTCQAVKVYAPATRVNNSQQAKELFNKVYNSVFGSQGSAFSYKVNIIGLYKTQGNIIYKGKKRHFSDEKVTAWEDGVTAYIADRKAKEVRIYRADDDRKDKWMGKFKYNLNDFAYSYTTKGDYYLITAKMKDASFFGIRHVTVKALKSNLYPVSVTIKLSFVRTTIQINGFRTGNISDKEFIFPHDKYKGYTFTDYRKN